MTLRQVEWEVFIMYWYDLQASGVRGIHDVLIWPSGKWSERYSRCIDMTFGQVELEVFMMYCYDLQASGVRGIDDVMLWPSGKWNERYSCCIAMTFRLRRGGERDERAARAHPGQRGLQLHVAAGRHPRAGRPAVCGLWGHRRLLCESVPLG